MFNPPEVEPTIEIIKEWILPNWAYLDEEWAKFSIEEINQGYFEYKEEVTFNGERRRIFT